MPSYQRENGVPGGGRHHCAAGQVAHPVHGPAASRQLRPYRARALLYAQRKPSALVLSVLCGCRADCRPASMKEAKKNISSQKKKLGGFWDRD